MMQCINSTKNFISKKTNDTHEKKNVGFALSNAMYYA